MSMRNQNLNNINFKEVLIAFSSHNEYMDTLKSEYLHNSTYNEEKKIWEYSKKTNTSRSYKYYIDKYPNGKYTEEAKKYYSNKLIIEEIDAWENAENNNTIEGYKEFIIKYPDSDKRDRALRNIGRLQEEEDRKDWNKAKSINNIKAYKEYLAKHPKGDYSSKANKKIKALIKEKYNFFLARTKIFFAILLPSLILFIIWILTDSFINEHKILSFFVFLILYISTNIFISEFIDKIDDYLYILLNILLGSFPIIYLFSVLKILILHHFLYVVIFVTFCFSAGLYLFLNNLLYKKQENAFPKSLLVVSLFAIMVLTQIHFNKERILTYQKLQNFPYLELRNDLIILSDKIKRLDSEIARYNNLLNKHNYQKNISYNGTSKQQLRKKIETTEKQRNKMVKKLAITYSILKKKELTIHE